MNEPAGAALACAAMATAAGIAAWTAWADRRARKRGLPGTGASVWSVLGAALLVLAAGRGSAGGWYGSLSFWLRSTARQHDVYAGRRPLQVALTLLVLVVVVVLLVQGVATLWRRVQERYRLAVGLAGLAVGAAAIRFVSLHEVDAWNAEFPWMHVAIDVFAAAGVSVVAAARLWTLRVARPREKTPAGGYPVPATTRGTRNTARSS